MTASNERAVRVRVVGRVQGVGYRAFVSAEASRRGVTGWTRNEADGSVAAVLHGPGGALAELVGCLRAGPPASTVEALDVQSIDAGAVADPPAGALRF